MTDLAVPILTPIWKDGAFRADDWTRFNPDSIVPLGSAPLLVSFSQFEAEPQRFLAHTGPLGVELPSGEAAQALAPYLDRLALIVLVFPKFHDGRSYSAARLLRERFGFKRELRAAGDVLADQIPLMRRCGIDSFDVRHAPTRAALEAGTLAEMHRYYQPIPNRPEVPAGTRPWLRRPAA